MPVRENGPSNLPAVVDAGRDSDDGDVRINRRPADNTTAPTGALTHSGWQYQGPWLADLGTPIAPRYFITAKHVGGSTNDTFGWNGYTYHPVGFLDCPATDLRVWRVAETFPRSAPLYTGTNEVGQPCVVIGRGTPRGAPVVVDGATNGWRWGTGDTVQRWGENVVAETLTIAELPGEYLRMAFNRGAGSNECHLSVGDSSGALFLADGGTWKLAGIHSTVDGCFSTDGLNSNKLLVALLDMGGLFVGGRQRLDLDHQPSGRHPRFVLQRPDFFRGRVDPKRD